MIDSNKTLCLIQGPASSRSGYGDRIRDVIRSLVKLKGDEWDIRIFDLPWGACPKNALNERDPNDALIISRLLVGNALPKQPDVFIQVSVPNEFQPVGKFNIGMTAGIETTICDPAWIEGCNRMNLILTSSHHSKKVFENSVYDKMDENTKQKVGELRLEKPIDVLFEGIDLNIFKKIERFPKTFVEEMHLVKESFCFLFVGHWLQGHFGHDRKDVGTLIKVFCETFKGHRKQPALILKSSGAGFSIMDRDDMLNKIRSISQADPSYPNVYLLHGDLTPEEMNALYNHPKVKAHVSFTKGEGYGRPLAEAAISGKPVITTNWSGHTDFLHPDYSILLPGQLMPVHESAIMKGLVNEGSRWFYVNPDYAGKILKDVYKNYKKYKERCRKLSHHIKSNFSLEKMAELLNTYIKEKVNTGPERVALNLPKLKKVDSGASEVPKIKLPKLNKV
jgi:glycosyltransferase involved in cell wall biosynthesis